MKGKYHVIVQNKRLRYEFDIKRNITIIRGDSATGKTTLYSMIALAARLGDSSGVEVQCEKKCRVLEELDWKLVLQNLHDQIIFLDEDNLFLKTTDFAGMVKESDNYFVIITREDLANLPYSVEEIYGIHTAGKYHDMKQVYNKFYHIYGLESKKFSVKK
jgi:predicted ATPase